MTTGLQSERRPSTVVSTHQWGVPGPVAAFFALVVAGVAGTIDVMTGPGLRTLFEVALIGSIAIAAIAVRRREILWVILAPPLISVIVALINKVTTSNSLVALMTDYLTHGFPPLAISVCVAVAIAAVRFALRR